MQTPTDTRPAGGSERLRELADEIESFNTARGSIAEGFNLTQWAAELRELASPQGADDCTEPNRADCPRRCMDFCNARETAAHPEQAASQGDAVAALVHKLIAHWTKQADMAEADAKRFGESSASRELLRDAAQYRQTIYQGELILAALSSPPGVQAAQVSIGANDVHWFEDAFRAWGNDDMAGVLDGLNAAVRHFVALARPGSAAQGGEVSGG